MHGFFPVMKFFHLLSTKYLVISRSQGDTIEGFLSEVRGGIGLSDWDAVNVHFARLT